MGALPRRKFTTATLATAVVAGVAALAVGGAPALADSSGIEGGKAKPGARSLDDPVFPEVGNGGYDVGTYDLRVTYDPESKLVEGRAVIHARATQALSEFSLDALGLDTESVRLLGAASGRSREHKSQSADEAATEPGVRAGYTVEDAKLVVEPARPIPNNSRFSVIVDYTADPNADIEGSGWVPADSGFALAPQPIGARAVFPCNDHPSDKARYQISVTAPAGMIGVATGLPAGTRSNPDGSTTYRFASAHPIATELVQIAVGDYEVVDRGRTSGVPLRDVVPSGRVDTLEPALALTPGHLTWIEKHLGAFPVEAYGLLPVDTDDPDAFDFTGLETQTLTVYKPTFLEQSEDQIASHMMHEIVHSWFGNSVTPADWSALWINEGHADLYGLIYRYERGWPDSQGFTTLEERMEYTYSQGDIWREMSGPVAEPTAENLFDNQRYTGGTLVLFALREFVGEDVFSEIEHRFLREFRDGTASTEDFIDVAVEVSGRADVRPFLEDWLYGTKTPPMPNHPDWTVEPVPYWAKLAPHGPQTDRLGH